MTGIMDCKQVPVTFNMQHLPCACQKDLNKYLIFVSKTKAELNLPNEADVNTESSVAPRTFKAHENPIRDGGPLRASIESVVKVPC